MTMLPYYFKTIKVPKTVVIKLLSGGCITNKAKGYFYIWIFSIFGYLKKRIPQEVGIVHTYNWLYIQCKSKAWVTTTYSMLKTLLFGLSKGFCSTIKVVGVGYKLRLIVSKNWLMLKLGFSHAYRIKLGFSEFKLFIHKRGILTLFSADLQYLNILGTRLRSFRSPDPYKSKGVMFLKESTRLKPGKREQV